MSEETALKLKEAEENRLAAGHELATRKEKFLVAIANEIPGRAAAVAKRRAHEQPEVTRGLGATRVQELRGMISSLAAKAAEDVVGAASLVDWPSTSRNSVPTSHQVFAPVREYLMKKVAPEFIEAFEQYGFSTSGTRPDWMVASALLAEEEVAADASALCKALLKQAKAESAVDEAKKADDEATVNDLRGD